MTASVTYFQISQKQNLRHGAFCLSVYSRNRMLSLSVSAFEPMKHFINLTLDEAAKGNHLIFAATQRQAGWKSRPLFLMGRTKPLPRIMLPPPCKG